MKHPISPVYSGTPDPALPGSASTGPVGASVNVKLTRAQQAAVNRNRELRSALKSELDTYAANNPPNPNLVAEVIDAVHSELVADRQANPPPKPPPPPPPPPSYQGWFIGLMVLIVLCFAGVLFVPYKSDKAPIAAEKSPQGGSTKAGKSATDEEQQRLVDLRKQAEANTAKARAERAAKAKAEINAIKTKADETNGKVGQLQTDVTELRKVVSEQVLPQMTQLATNSVAASAKIGAMDERLTKAEGAITTLQGETKALGDWRAAVTTGFQEVKKILDEQPAAAEKAKAPPPPPAASPLSTTRGAANGNPNGAYRPVPVVYGSTSKDYKIANVLAGKVRLEPGPGLVVTNYYPFGSHKFPTEFDVPDTGDYYVDPKASAVNFKSKSLAIRPSFNVYEQK